LNQPEIPGVESVGIFQQREQDKFFEKRRNQKKNGKMLKTFSLLKQISSISQFQSVAIFGTK
jgi:hypothetical protein